MAARKRRPMRDAMDWLDEGSGNNFIAELDVQQSVELVRMLYGMGAQHVYVTNIATNQTLSSTDTVVVELPKDSAKRQQLFEWNAERVRMMGYEPEIDNGAAELLLWFD